MPRVPDPDPRSLDSRELLKLYAVRAAEVQACRTERAALAAFSTLGPMEVEILRRMGKEL